MFKKLLPFLMVLGLLLSSCSTTIAPAPSATPPNSAVNQPDTDATQRTLLATTYPIYLFTTAITEGVEGIQVELLVNEPVSCIHDYTLTVNDMKRIEAADVILINGAELEEFMEDALESSTAPVIDCSTDVTLLPYHDDDDHDDHDHDDHDHDHDHDEDDHDHDEDDHEEEAHDHDHDEEAHDHDHGDFDPHIWLSPDNAALMLATIATQLSDLDSNSADLYAANLAKSVALLDEIVVPTALADMPLITFHDGFQYMADYAHLHLMKAIEEEPGAEASAAEINEIVELIRSHSIPAIFTETNGSDSTAQAISRETGVEIYSLDLLMSGSHSGMDPYINCINSNFATLLEAFT